MAADVTPDGSPIAAYLVMPADRELALLIQVLVPPATILELGCGPGRLANPLAAAGHRVVGVDDSAEALAHLDGVEPVLADVWQLQLGERFDVVLALSHLINDRSAERRRRLLEVCRKHVTDDGMVVIQRYPPAWRPEPRCAEVGRVQVEWHDIESLVDGFRAAVTYTLDDISWTQRFESAVVDDDALNTAASVNGLVIDRSLTDDEGWVTLRRV